MIGEGLSFDPLRSVQAKIAIAIGGLLAFDGYALAVQSHEAQPQGVVCIEQFCGQAAMLPLPKPLETHHRHHHKHHAPKPAETHTPTPKPKPHPTHQTHQPRPKPSPAHHVEAPQRPLAHVLAHVRQTLRQALNPLLHLADKTGNDISFTDCSKKALPLPHTGPLRIVGLTDFSSPGDANPCLEPELAWAKQTAPKNRMFYEFIDPKATTFTSPDNSTNARYYQRLNPYVVAGQPSRLRRNWNQGWNEAMVTLDDNLLPKAQAVGLRVVRGEMMWLDVEGPDYYQHKTAMDQASNQALLEGMAAANENRGLRSGIYTIKSAWDPIVGSVESTSILYDEPEWRPTVEATALGFESCQLPSVTDPSKVLQVMTQGQEKYHHTTYDTVDGC